MKPSEHHPSFLGEPFEVLGVAPHPSGWRLREQGVAAVAPNLVESPGFSSPRISRPGGGIGRRGRLKIGRPHGRVGSNPTPGITSIAPSALHDWSDRAQASASGIAFSEPCVTVLRATTASRRRGRSRRSRTFVLSLPRKRGVLPSISEEGSVR